MIHKIYVYNAGCQAYLINICLQSEYIQQGGGVEGIKETIDIISLKQCKKVTGTNFLQKNENKNFDKKVQIF